MPLTSACKIAGFGPNLRFVCTCEVSVITDDDKIVTKYRSTGTHLGSWDGMEGTGNKVDIEEMSIYPLENGKIIRKWGFWDEKELKKQMNVNTLKK